MLVLFSFFILHLSLYVPCLLSMITNCISARKTDIIRVTEQILDAISSGDFEGYTYVSSLTSYMSLCKLASYMSLCKLYVHLFSSFIAFHIIITALYEHPVLHNRKMLIFVSFFKKTLWYLFDIFSFQKTLWPQHHCVWTWGARQPGGGDRIS